MNAPAFNHFLLPSCGLTLATFAAWDWSVLVGYFALVLGLGTMVAWLHRVRGSADYFLAARSMPTWAVAISILSTAQSAATFIGAPGQSFTGDLTYLSSNIGQVIAAVILAWVFIPAYYRAGVSTPYELLERRFGAPARLATSIAYLIGRVLSSGSRVFIGALPMSLVIFGDTSSGHMAISIGIVSVIGTLYALAGGIRSVIWTDVLQVAVYLGSAVVAIVLLVRAIDAPIAGIWQALAGHSPTGTIGADGAPAIGPNKLTVFRSGFDAQGHYDFAATFTIPTALTGFVLMGLASYGMDQDLVQRMLTCKSAAKGARSVLGGVLVGIPAVCVFMAIGLLLHVFYQRPDLTGEVHTLSRSPNAPQEVFLQFILDHAPTGVLGLMMAGLFASGMAPLTAMSASFLSDVVEPLRQRRAVHDRSNAPATAPPSPSTAPPNPKRELFLARACVVMFGVLLGLVALACIAWYDPKKTTLVTFALSVMTFAYAGLLGVFLTALFTQRGNAASAIAALITGFVVVIVLEPAVWSALTAAVGWTDWSSTSLAFPWRLTIGAAASTLVCLCGSPTRVAAPQSPPPSTV